MPFHVTVDTLSILAFISRDYGIKAGTRQRDVAVYAVHEKSRNFDSRTTENSHNRAPMGPCNDSRQPCSREVYRLQLYVLRQRFSKREETLYPGKTRVIDMRLTLAWPDSILTLIDLKYDARSIKKKDHSKKIVLNLILSDQNCF